MEYTVLTFCGQFVDESRLFEGIYPTFIPNLHLIDTTIEMLIENKEKYHYLINDGIDFLFDINTYKENLKKCTISTVKLEKIN